MTGLTISSDLRSAFACCPGKSLSIAREQEANLWELRAAASLARLRRDQSRCAAARDLLAPIYGCFTECFATPVLKQAKIVLDEL